MRCSFPAAVDQAPDKITDNKYQHAANRGRDHQLVEQIDVIDQRGLFGAGNVVAQPCLGIVLIDPGVTLLAFKQQILFDGDTVLRIVHFDDIVNAVAVDTNRFIGRLVGGSALEERNRRPVEIGHIGIEHLG